MVSHYFSGSSGAPQRAVQSTGVKAGHIAPDNGPVAPHLDRVHRRWRVQLPFQTGGAWPTDAKEADHKLRWSAPLRRTYGARPAEFVLCAAFRGPFQARIGGFGAETGDPGVEIAATEGLGRLERGWREAAMGVDGTNPIPGVGG